MQCSKFLSQDCACPTVEAFNLTTLQTDKLLLVMLLYICKYCAQNKRLLIIKKKKKARGQSWSLEPPGPTSYRECSRFGHPSGRCSSLVVRRRGELENISRQIAKQSVYTSRLVSSSVERATLCPFFFSQWPFHRSNGGKERVIKGKP